MADAAGVSGDVKKGAFTGSWKFHITRNWHCKCQKCMEIYILLHNIFVTQKKLAELEVYK